MILSFFYGKKGRKSAFFAPENQQKTDYFLLFQVFFGINFPFENHILAIIFSFVEKKEQKGGCFQFVPMGFSLHQDELFTSSGRNIYLIRTNWRKFSLKTAQKKDLGHWNTRGLTLETRSKKEVLAGFFEGYVIQHRAQFFSRTEKDTTLGDGGCRNFSSGVTSFGTKSHLEITQST